MIAVLVLTPQAEQPAELIADDRLHDQRVGEPQRERLNRPAATRPSSMRARPSIHCRSGDGDTSMS